MPFPQRGSPGPLLEPQTPRESDGLGGVGVAGYGDPMGHALSQVGQQLSTATGTLEMVCEALGIDKDSTRAQLMDALRKSWSVDPAMLKETVWCVDSDGALYKLTGTEVYLVDSIGRLKKMNDAPDWRLSKCVDPSHPMRAISEEEAQGIIATRKANAKKK
jgi:hypothetical protein